MPSYEEGTSSGKTTPIWDLSESEKLESVSELSLEDTPQQRQGLPILSLSLNSLVSDLNGSSLFRLAIIH